MHILQPLVVLALTVSTPQPREYSTQEGKLVETIEPRKTTSSRERLTLDDEIDALERRIKPPERFADYRPAWRVELRSFDFQHDDGVKPRTFHVIRDGEKTVAVIRSGDIMLLAPTPAAARTAIGMPTERLHLDNMMGPSLPTWSFIKQVKTHGSIYETLGDRALPREHFEIGDRHLAYIREQELPEYRVTASFTFTVDPVFGYRIDAERAIVFTAPPKTGEFSLGAGTFTPGCYVPWKYQAWYDRTVYTPAGGGLEGWANNLFCMDRCDGDPARFRWRDGGYIAYLPAPDGWSPCFTRKDGAGDSGPMKICNAHNDFHHQLFVPELKKVDGAYPYRYVHRLLWLPPELTRQAWDDVKLIQQGTSGMIIKIGEVEDFEQQPVPLTEPARGLIFTSGGPQITHACAHSGRQSILIQGRQWPNLPQISLLPGKRYRLEGWFKVVPWTDAQTAEHKRKDEEQRVGLRKKGKPVPPEIDWNHLDAKAYISGDFYRWSPHSEEMLLKQRTTEAKPGVEDWQHVTLDFDSPAWGPAFNIAFHAEYCDAYLDDFALRVIDKEE